MAARSPSSGPTSRPWHRATPCRCCCSEPGAGLDHFAAGGGCPSDACTTTIPRPESASWYASPDPRPIAAPSFAPLRTASSAPSDEEPSAAPSDGDDGPVDTGASADIGAALESKIAEYKKLRDSGALWERIPDTEFNRTAVTAFLFFLSDMKAATIWGVDDATATEYEERMAMLEQKLLDQKPLGDNIKITFEGGKVFQYNGETGEGGYTQE